jgi:hypothetical protein
MIRIFLCIRDFIHPKAIAIARNAAVAVAYTNHASNAESGFSTADNKTNSES